MRLILLIWTIIMPVLGFADPQTWEQFNSSLLIEVTREKGVFTCTGVAVTQTLIVTAAHCLEGDVKKVRIFTQSSYDPNAPAIAVKSFKIHPDYHPKDSRYNSDLGKIVLAEKLPGNIKIYPIYKEPIITGSLYRFGFGMRNKKNLRTVITPTFKQVLYAEKVVELNDTYSFSGDSGGPIYLQQGANSFVLAVHSTLSYGPQGRFSYNPLLSSYSDWIFEN